MKRILSWIYGAIVFVRNLLYDEHILYAYSPKIPTICVGNLAVGGTGKTPHTEYLVGLLLREGYKVAVLSRGYKRRTKGFQLADAQSTADTLGDEPRQMQLKFPEAIVAVSEDRRLGIRRLTRQFPDLDVIVLDDAFQHRKVHCGFSILLTPADSLYVNDHLMPYGRLREPAHGANRADVVVVSKCPADMRPIDRRVITTALHCPSFQDLCFSSVRYAEPVPVFPLAPAPAATAPAPAAPAPAPAATASAPAPAATALFDATSRIAADAPVFLLTGIAQPHYLRDALGDRVVGELSFSDHHRYTQQDMSRLSAMLKPLDPTVAVLTTEKDAARLRDSSLVPEALQPRLYYLPVSVDFGADKEAFDRRVIRYVRENRRLQK